MGVVHRSMITCGLVAALALLFQPAVARAEISLAYDGIYTSIVTSVAVDHAGNLFASSPQSNNVFKVTPAGDFILWLDASGDGAGSPLVSPTDLVTDSAGNLYVSDSSHRVFQVTPSGAVTVVLDNTIPFPFLLPRSITIDASDTLYVGLRDSDNVVSQTAGGLVDELIDASGDGGGNGLDAVQSLAMHPSGDVIVGGFASDNAFRVTPGGAITQIIDATGDGLGSVLDQVNALTTDASGNVFVGGFASDNVFKVTPAGTITEVLDFTGDGTRLFRETLALGTDSFGNLFAVSETDALFMVTPGGTKSIVIGPDSTDEYIFIDSPALAVDAGDNVYAGGRPVFEFSPGGNIEPVFYPIEPFVVRTAKDGSGRTFFATAFAVYELLPGGAITEILGPSGDGAGNVVRDVADIETDALGNLYVAASRSNNAFKVTSGGVITEIIDATGDGAGALLDSPVSLAVDTAGNVFVACEVTDNVFKVTPGGVVSQVLDASGDGAGNLLDRPFSIAVDNAGNAFVAGRSTDNVFKVDSGGSITQVIDSTGDGASNPMIAPTALKTDSSGNLYVTCWAGTPCALKLEPGGAITEFIDESGDGLGNGLDRPILIGVDAADNVYVFGDRTDNVLRIAPDGLITELLTVDGAEGQPMHPYLSIDATDSGELYVAARSDTDNSYNIINVTFETASCAPAPAVGCISAPRATITASEKSVGREKLKVQWKGMTDLDNKGDFGNPVDGDTSIALCLYDDSGTLVEDYLVDRAGDSCSGKPCWKNHAKGYNYKDKLLTSDGIGRVNLQLSSGGGRMGLKGKNNSKNGQLALPTGITAGLSGSVAPTLQLISSDEVCFSATLNTVKADTGIQYKAQLK